MSRTRKLEVGLFLNLWYPVICNFVFLTDFAIQLCKFGAENSILWVTRSFYLKMMGKEQNEHCNFKNMMDSAGT
jgi:hypothetical protein